MRVQSLRTNVSGTPTTTSSSNVQASIAFIERDARHMAQAQQCAPDDFRNVSATVEHDEQRQGSFSHSMCVWGAHAIKRRLRLSRLAILAEKIVWQF
jgi:hypothetical protein